MRGMGVADITSVWVAFSARAARWLTPNRCCSSVTTSPSFEKGTVSDNSACVPIRREISPASKAENKIRRSFSVVFPVSSPARREARSQRGPRERKCCSASSSVGAIKAV